MADIQSAAQLIGRLLVEEARYLSSVEGKVMELQEELEWMQCFLRETDARQFNSAMARKWVARIREYAYEAEDMIEKFLIKVYPVSKGRADLLSLFKKYSRVVWQVSLVYRTGSEIDKLKNKISALSSKLHTYRIELQNKMGKSSSSVPSNLELNTYYNVQEEKIIGRENAVNELVSKLVNPESSSSSSTSVIAICGEGGVGKTFLAKKIFCHQDIRRKFYACAWAYVSQPCQISSVMQELLSSLTSKSSEQIAQMTDDELEDGLYKALSKCSLIVLDGIWSKEVWEGLKAAFFPIVNRRFTSKLLLTARMEEVAKHVDENAYIHSLTCLGNEESESLLREKVGHAQSSIFHEKNADLLKKMLKLCGGLPLNIVVLGGILATNEWEIVLENIKSYSIDNPDLYWRLILELSYYHLPYQLKQCFLYLGYFPTNLQISTRKIIQLWEAEGLVSSTEDDETEDVTAERCLATLVERSLVQVGSRGLTGKAKTCQLHQLIRDFCMAEASKGNWLNVYELGGEPKSSSSPSSPKSVKSSKSAKRRFRRLAIYCSDTFVQLPSNYRHASYIRSLLFFNALKGEDVLMPLRRRALRKAFTDFKLLRVLDIENIQVQRLPDEVGFLIHLRYLNLKGSWVSELPSTVKNLRCLQTLDLRVLSFVQMRIPDVLYRLDKLIHLYLPPNSFALRHGATKLRLGGLRNLETLSNFSSTCEAGDLGCLTHLRKFTSSDFLSEIPTCLTNSSIQLGHMEHIALRLDGEILKNQRGILKSCRNLRKLWVKGEITGPIDSIQLPHSLIRLSFHLSKFQGDDPMLVLGKLPYLRSLSLEHASYEGAKMQCSREGFKELRYLTLRGLEGLQDWEVEEGAMPKLVNLEINRCSKLKTIPEGLRSVQSLEELTVSYMPLSFFQNWTPEKKLEEWSDFSKVSHVPCIKISHIMSSEAAQLQSCLGET